MHTGTCRAATRWVVMIALAAGLATHVAASGLPQPYWVFFTDHGPGTAELAPLATRIGLGARDLDPAQMLQRVRAFPSETWARRARAGVAVLPDIHDLPPHAAYVRAVAQAGRLRHCSRWLNAVSVDLTPAALARVSALPCVAAVRPVAVATPAGFGPTEDETGQPLETLLREDHRLTPPTPAWAADSGSGSASEFRFGPAWIDHLSYGPALGQLEEIGVPAVHALGYSGNGVRVMMIDTGFRKDHDAFRHTDLLAEWDFVFGDGETQNEPEDWPWQHNHGTGTWSVAGGFAPGHVIGPAYGATFLLAKTENPLEESRIEEDNYVAALEWGDSLGVNVTSASLNYICFGDGFCYQTEDKDGHTAVISMAVAIAAARGILCVNSLGNYSCAARTTMGTPADADSMLAVGAVDSFNVIASFSSCGPTYDGRTKPEVVARGVYAYMAGAASTDTYGPGSGTSFSTPLVAGAAALLMEAHPEWSAMQVRRALMTTADRALVPDDRYGWGRINVQAALQQAVASYPLPFSLEGPAAGAWVADLAPAFTWQASHDPDSAQPLTYWLRIQDLTAGAEDAGDQAGSSGRLASDAGWMIPAGTDTTCVLPFSLTPGKTYRWEVIAEDADGHRRVSRECAPLRITGNAASAPALPGASTLPGPRVALAANPFRGGLRFQVQATVPLSDTPAWSIYDPTGRRVAAGTMKAQGLVFAGMWDGRDATGRDALAGVYFLEIRAGHRFVRETLVRLGD
jgi:hypothetical protein